jgi:hypothetical protein
MRWKFASGSVSRPRRSKMRLARSIGGEMARTARVYLLGTTYGGEEEAAKRSPPYEFFSGGRAQPRRCIAASGHAAGRMASSARFGCDDDRTKEPEPRGLLARHDERRRRRSSRAFCVARVIQWKSGTAATLHRGLRPCGRRMASSARFGPRQCLTTRRRHATGLRGSGSGGSDARSNSSRMASRSGAEPPRRSSRSNRLLSA